MIMIHDSTWLGRTRAMRRMRLTAQVGLLLACVLLAGLPAAASATTPDVRGEWELTFKASTESLHGKALVTEAANAKGEFASHSMFLENVIPGTFTGTLEGAMATVKTTTVAYGPVPAGEFNSKTMVVEAGVGSLALSGSGTLILGGKESSPTLTATRIRTYKQIEEQEARELKERQEKEAKEKEAREAREAKEAKEAKERQEKEAHEAAEGTAREKKERELKERQEREAREAAEKATAAKTTQGSTTTNTGNPLMPVGLATKTLTLGHGGAISLDLTNPGGSPVHGHLKLTLAKAGKTSSAKHTTGGGKNSTLGEASFSIAGHGTEVVKVKLSRSGRAQLARHKTLHVLVTVTTQASGQPEVTKSYALTLHAPGSAHHKG
jgi:outer membrane biosynthesis protein TonB